MKKWILTALLVGTTMTATAAEKIVFATTPSYPPFELTNEKGEIIGFDIDIAKAVCKEIQADCSFKSLAFDAIIPSLMKKRGIDAAISAIDITKARAKQVAFTQPYYESSAAFIAVKGKTDLNNAKTVGVQNGTTYQQYATKELSQFQSKSYTSLQEAVLDLVNGRIDLIFGDTDVLRDMFTKNPELTFIGEKITDKRYFNNGLGIAVNKENSELVQRLNQGIEAIKANGEYQRIYTQWLTQ